MRVTRRKPYTLATVMERAAQTHAYDHYLPHRGVGGRCSHYAVGIMRHDAGFVVPVLMYCSAGVLHGHGKTSTATTTNQQADYTCHQY